ncbi:hypothetical protein KFZ70_07395 [Tamlana fucoidanivorans]|uniref:Toxin-antitoxin system YwqK family antitoxin n=1 Tax=Allotamlana fucoidanivorans TaxID=2583814 RepID=A0A5C4SKW5_9FLAO|nr:hypothetical protein FGF67_10800 [Tamlana fucoidanivorans]
MRLPLCLAFFVGVVFTVSAQKVYQKNYDPQQLLISEGWMQSHKKQNYWYFYHPNGKIKAEGHYTENVKTNYWIFYNYNGKKEKEGRFLQNKKSGWWLFYDKNQNIEHKCQLKDNLKNGFCLIYKNEVLVAASKYKSGKKLKEWTNFADFKRDNKLSNLK